MSRLTVWAWLGLIVVGLLAGAAGVVLALQIEHWRADEADVHLMKLVLQYNVQRGHLEPLPGPGGPPTAPTPAPGKPAP